MIKPSNTGSRRSAAEWRHLIDQQRDSDQTQAAFCQTQGVNLATFQYWKRRLRDEAAAPAASAWVELPVGRKPPEGGWEIELDLGEGIRLKLSRR